jgi:tripartite-type tricarboxylate transporter receptor subunit TctC
MQARRVFLRRSAAVCGLGLITQTVAASGYPARPVRLVTGFAPGGPMDIAARLIGAWLGERLAQPFVVENRPGAGGNIGTEYVVRAPADGHTLLVCGPVNTINAALYSNLPFDFARDIVPVAGLVRVPLVLLVNPAVPATSVEALIAFARANPGKLSLASSGNGTPQHVSGELFKQMAGIDLLHVPYRGSGPALADLLGGQVQVMLDAVPSAIEHIRAGRLRALAVSTTARAAVLPELPPLADTLPGYDASSWYGIGAPRHTPGNLVALLNAEINAGLADPRLAAQFTERGAMIMAGTPADLARLIADEMVRWSQVVRTANIRID